MLLFFIFYFARKGIRYHSMAILTFAVMDEGYKR